MKVAVYGTLKSMHGNHALLRDQEFIGQGEVQGYRLYTSGIPYAVPDSTSDYPVQVEVYNLDACALEAVDMLERHPDWYRRTLVPVQMQDGTEEQAWLYQMPEANDYWQENTSGNF